MEERKKLENSLGKKYLLIGKKVGGKERLLEDGYLVMGLYDIVGTDNSRES